MGSNKIYQGVYSKGNVTIRKGFGDPIILDPSDYFTIGKIYGKIPCVGKVITRGLEEIALIASQKFLDYNLLAIKYDMTTTGKQKDTIEMGLVIKVNSKDVLKFMESEVLTIKN